MSAKHTAGPWEVDMYGDVIANGEDVARIAGFYGAAENEANARLIAAAPELLEALREMVGWYARRESASMHGIAVRLEGYPLLPFDQQEEEVQNAMKAIALATGETE